MNDKKFDTMTAAELLAMPTNESYFLPWTLKMVYEVEPELKIIAERAAKCKHRSIYTRLEAYSETKWRADKLIGWGARDPRLRCSGAWDVFIDHIINELRL